MIKTEIENDEAASIPEEVETDNEVLPFAPIGAAWTVGLAAVLVIIAASLGSYLLYTNSSSTQPIPPARNIGNVPALPLKTNPSSGQAATTANSLNASSINLQNNLPSGQGSPKTNSLQTTGNSLSTGQTVNTNFPF